ncbi:Glycine cleavage system transcriptional activator [Paraburkholderia caffeinitolerans]|uniref:Glycine cleavage system transcriptional activator n=1 Tax=Paraburkholderia caffeinitolerans TaxID=1723730 RepID=A0A6J5FRM4_9BURK|nr:LysR substrate-binding domain-containing protein [Paraburkholderia caffeinitolerans]CAB3785400.1 Glycine cleavage system transcriptional activator [Paraburkholderia caffeinitolerans]
MRRLPPLQALLAFDAAARLGSFTRAAQELALTQSAISHQIQQLEEWTGQPLFRRIGRGVALTAAGSLYAQTVTAALTTLADGRDRIEPYGNPDSVIVVCTAEFASGWLMPRMRAFSEALGNIEVWLVTGEDVNEIDRVDVDLVVSPKEIRTPEVVCEHLLDEEAVAICGPATERRLRSVPFPDVLTQAPLLVHEARPEWAPWLPDLRRNGLRTRRAMTVSDPRFLVAAAGQELGIAMVSRLAAGDALTSGRIKVLPQVPGFALAPLWLMRSAQPARSAAVNAVHEWMLRLSRSQGDGSTR